MRRLWAVWLALGLIAVLAAVAYKWQLDFHRDLSRYSEKEVDTAVKGTLGLLLAPERSDGNEAERPDGLLEVYKKNPQQFRDAAAFMDTWMNASRIGRLIASQNQPTTPATSENIPSLDPKARIDAWGHYYCLGKVGDRAVVVSGGSSAKTAPNCNQLDFRDLAAVTPGKPRQMPSGLLVLTVRANKQAR